MTTEKRVCFVIMPFSESGGWNADRWTQFFDYELRPILLAHDYDCIRSTADRGNIIKDIVQRLASSHLVLADLTGLNYNVFYELGIRHSLSRRTLMITQDDPNTLPFDLKTYGCRRYSVDQPRDRAAFREMLAGLITGVDADPHKDDSPVADFVSLERVLENATESARLKRILGSFDRDLFAHRVALDRLVSNQSFGVSSAAMLIESPACQMIRAEGLTENSEFLVTLDLYVRTINTLRLLVSLIADKAFVMDDEFENLRADAISLRASLAESTTKLLEALAEARDASSVVCPRWDTIVGPSPAVAPN